jgi:hypothetical protein
VHNTDRAVVQRLQGVRWGRACAGAGLGLGQTHMCTLKHNPSPPFASMPSYMLAGEDAVNEVEAVFAQSSHDSKLSLQQLHQLASIARQHLPGANLEDGIGLAHQKRDAIFRLPAIW